MASELILNHLEDHHVKPSDLRRAWMHQANANMNRLVCKKVLGRDISHDLAPTVLDTYANTASAGCLIAFHKYHDDISEGDLGIICSFGAGYSIGNIIIQKISL